MTDKSKRWLEELVRCRLLQLRGKNGAHSRAKQRNPAMAELHDAAIVGNRAEIAELKNFRRNLATACPVDTA